MWFLQKVCKTIMAFASKKEKVCEKFVKYWQKRRNKTWRLTWNVAEKQKNKRKNRPIRPVFVIKTCRWNGGFCDLSGINLMTFTYRNVDVFRYENGDYLFSVYYKLSRSCFYKYVIAKACFWERKTDRKRAFCCRLSYMFTV